MPSLKFSSKFLYPLLFIFLLVDFILLFSYLSKPPLKKNPSRTSTSQEQSTKESQALQILRGDLNRGSLDEAEIPVKVLTKPEESNNPEVFEVEAELMYKKSTYKLVVNLGKKEDKVLINKKNEANWVRESIDSLITLVKVGDIIKLRFYIQNPDAIINSPKCDTVCKEELKKVQPFIDNNNKIITALQNEIPSEDKLTIGALTAVSFN